MLYLQIESPKSSVLNFLDSNSFEVIISIFQRTEKVPDMERLLLDGVGYDLGTKILIFWRKMLSRRSLSTIQPRFRIFYVKDTNYFCIKLTTLANDL